MSDKKLTDAEIIKALECCASGEVEECKNCPYVEGYPYCDGPMERDVLDLINRKDAEIERLKPFENKIAGFNSHIRVEDMLVFANSLEEWLEFCDNLKAEAYKEFAEKLENRILSMLTTATLEEKETVCFCLDKLKNLLKELVDEDNESKN